MSQSAPARNFDSAASYLTGGLNVETTLKTMILSRHGSHTNILAELQFIGLQQCGHVMSAQLRNQMLVPV
jgi:hypothetical protein